VSGRHTYEVRYTVGNAVHLAPDTAVLYWQFVGTEAPKLDVDVRIKTLASSRDQLQAWGHGVLEGELSYDGTDVLLHVTGNTAGNFVEVRQLEPATDFAGTPSGPPLHAAIQAAEQAAADQANAKRRELEAQVHREHVIHEGPRRRFRRRVRVGHRLAVPIFRRYGAELPKPADIPEYWRDPPNDPPAVSQAVMRFGSVKDDAFTCTLVDLAQRGYLTITEPKRKEFAFERTAKPLDGLLPFESDALTKLFGRETTATQAEFLARLKANRTQSAKWISGFKSKVSHVYGGYGFDDKSAPWKWAAVGALALVCVVVGLITAFGKDNPLGFVALATGVGLACAMPTLRKRTPAGNRTFYELKGLRRYLKDFTRLGTTSRTWDVVLYERYLVFAVALGVAKEFSNGLRATFPAEVEGANGVGFAPWYVPYAAGGFANSFAGMSSSIDSFSQGFASATSAAASPPSSSSGGGGGFSAVAVAAAEGVAAGAGDRHPASRMTSAALMVSAQSAPHRGAQPVVGRPLRVADLADQLRLEKQSAAFLDRRQGGAERVDVRHERAEAAAATCRCRTR
jgi:uncharacterized membrane protein